MTHQEYVVDRIEQQMTSRIQQRLRHRSDALDIAPPVTAKSRAGETLKQSAGLSDALSALRFAAKRASARSRRRN